MVAVTSLFAWSILIFGGNRLILPLFCSAGASPHAPLWASLDLAFAFNPPVALAFDWALMIAAMMLPATIAPVRHVRERSFASRRARATTLFVMGYIAVWMGAGLVLLMTALVIRWAAPTSLTAMGIAVVAALLWQGSPAKQWCLNRCHRRPHLAAFGAAADCGAFKFGLMNGAFCAGSCWALMLLPLLLSYGHIPAMIVITLLTSVERVERPAPPLWRWRVPSKAFRIVVEQTRLRVRNSATATFSNSGSLSRAA